MAGATHLLGHTVGRYHIESVIGTGGFATVYRAVDTALERPVALKVVDPSAHRSPTIGRRFLLEGKAVASLNHPAVVPVYDAGEQDGVLWLAMRLIEGASLDDALVAGRRFRPDEICELVGRIGAALDHAHARGIVHRDVKPSNILLEENDPAKAWLTDFGIAATARTAGLYTTGVIGTAAYMAPEQSRPSEVGPSADIYSLACVVYELVSGHRAFEGDDYVVLLLAHATAPIPSTGTAAIDEVFARALAKTPDARPASGAAFAEELRGCLADLRSDAAPSEATQAMEPAWAKAGADSSPSSGSNDTTVIDHSDRTLVYPVSPQPVPSQAGPAPQGYGPPPPAGPGAARRPPPPPPRSQYQPPPQSQPRDPTVVRTSRRGARRSFVGGIAVLLLGAGAAGYAYAELRQAEWRTVTDAAGVQYDVHRSWDEDENPPTVVWQEESGSTVLIVTHRRLENPDDRDAARILADTQPALCHDEGESPAEQDIPGADAAAICDNSGGDEPARAIAAINDGELWLFELHSSTSDRERDKFLDNVVFD